MKKHLLFSYFFIAIALGFCTQIFTQLPYKSLEALEKQLMVDLARIEYPAKSWRTPPAMYDENIYDVVIIGGGQAGLAAAFALLRQGVTNIKIFDKNPDGAQGPWNTIARMKTLRSGKHFMGPALSIPNLTFQAWYCAQFGQLAWDSLIKAPTGLWGQYLQWYKKVLNLPVQYNCKLATITPHSPNVHLTLEDNGKQFEVTTRKLVLVTGRDGFGGIQIPEILTPISKEYYTHTSQPIAPATIHNKNIVIIGVGSAAFDAAAFALENGAQSVSILMRRATPPKINKSVYLGNCGAFHGFYSLPKDYRWNLFKIILTEGAPVPIESIERLKQFKNVTLYPNSTIKSINEKDSQLEIATATQVFTADHILVATGFNFDGMRQPELESFLDQIYTWDNVMDHQETPIEQKMSRFPYLGPSFEFVEKNVGQADYLKNIHCFNYAATLSHGLIAGDIPGISFGAERLARGIVADLFVADAQKHETAILEYSDGALANDCFDRLIKEII